MMKNSSPSKLRLILGVCLGAVSGVDTGTRGTYFFDAFKSLAQLSLAHSMTRSYRTQPLAPFQPLTRRFWRAGAEASAKQAIR